MSNDKYTGPVGPADALGATDAKFMAAYQTATAAMLEAVLQFEKATGRVVDDIDLVTVDVTTFADPCPRHLRHAAIHFLPKPGEVAW